MCDWVNYDFEESGGVKMRGKKVWLDVLYEYGIEEEYFWKEVVIWRWI